MNEPTKDVQKLREELETLIKEFHDENGKISQRISYLKTPKGKQILELAIACGLVCANTWKETTDLLQRSQSDIEKALSAHRIRIQRSKHILRSAEELALIEACYKRSHEIKNISELKDLKEELLRKLKDLTGKTMTLNSVRCVAREKPWGHWGMSKEERRGRDRKIIDEVFAQENLSKDERWEVLLTRIPNIKSERAMRHRLKDLGYSEKIRQMETKTIQGAKKSLWDNQKIIVRIRQLVEQGILVKNTIDVGIKEIHSVIQKEFASVLAEDNEIFDIQSLKNKLDEIIWTTDRVQKLKAALKSRLSPTEYHEFNSDIPLELIEKQFQERHGTTTKRFPPTFLKGLEHFDPSLQKEIIKLPERIFSDPVKLDDSVLDNGLEIFNGLEFGTDYEPDIEENLVRRSFASAERRGAGAIILTNVIDIHVRKTASSNMVELAGISGHLLDEQAINLLDPDYQETAREVMQAIKRDPTTEKMLYVKPIDILKLTFKGLYKVAYKTGKSGSREPEYNGKVYLLLSHKDEEIVSALAGTRSAENTMSARGRAAARLQLAVALRTRIERENPQHPEIDDLDKKIEKLRAEVEYTKVSNSAKNNSDRYAEQAWSMLIRGYQGAIPNCTVIGRGTTYVQAGNNKLEIHIPGDVQVTETALTKYASSYGPKALRNQFADAIVICPQYSFNYRHVGREHTGEGDRKSSPVFVAPMLINDKYLSQTLSTGKIIKSSAHKLLKVLRSEITCTGLLRLDFDGEKKEIISPATFPINAFVSSSKKAAIKLDKKVVPISPSKAFGDEPYFCIYVATDPHRGGRAREIIWSPQKQMYLGVHEATIDLMIRGGLYNDPNFPVPTFLFICDDIVQGLNFPAYSQTHPHLISQGDMEKLWAEEIERAKKDRSRRRMDMLLEMMHKEYSYQRRIQGTDWVENQLLEATTEMLEPYAEFFHLMLANAVDSGIELLGMSHYEHVRSDTRDLGFINYSIMGNHLARTVDGHVAEGNRMARETRFLVRSLPGIDRWRNNPSILEKLVRAPNFSGEFIGGATVSLSGGKPWGILGRSSPTTLSSWGDPLGAAVRKELQRGDHLGFQRFVESTLMIVGDKHFDASCETSWLKGEMGPAGSHTDRYGQRGFPPNDTGVKFILIPAGGPGTGPILRRTLMSWNLRHYIEENPSAEFNWKRFLPNVIRAT